MDPMFQLQSWATAYLFSAFTLLRKKAHSLSLRWARLCTPKKSLHHPKIHPLYNSKKSPLPRQIRFQIYFPARCPFILSIASTNHTCGFHRASNRRPSILKGSIMYRTSTHSPYSLAVRGRKKPSHSLEKIKSFCRMKGRCHCSLSLTGIGTL